MVKIRLRRKGKKFYPVYDIVAMASRSRRNGAYLERLGYYDPNTEKSTIKINHEKAIAWLNNGAQPSDVVRLLLSYDGVLLRRNLQGKGKSESEIDAEVAKHQAVAAARYERRKKLRVERAVRKVKQAEEAKRKAEQEAAAEEAAAAAAESAKAQETTE